MDDERKIARFEVPTLADLQELKTKDVDDTVLETVRRVLAGEVDPREVSPKAAKWYADCYHKPNIKGHELKLCACDDLLGTCGVESLNIEDADDYTDGGIRMCPPFSYCNNGDSYVPTLARDHKASAWVVAGWADLVEEYERDNEIGDHEVFETCPERCPDCHGKFLSLEYHPHHAGGPRFGWTCDDCNHSCAMPEGPANIGDDAHVAAVSLGEGAGVVFSVIIDDKQWTPLDGSERNAWDDPQQARETYLNSIRGDH